MRRVCSHSYMHMYTTIFIDGIFDHKMVNGRTKYKKYACGEVSKCNRICKSENYI